MAYADITTNDPNPIKRWHQRNRFTEAISLLPHGVSVSNILDFGGGDGELCLRLKQHMKDVEVICYEPSLEIYQEADKKISNSKYKDQIQLINNIEGIKPKLLT